MPRILRRRNLLVVALIIAALVGAYFGGLLSLVSLEYNENTQVLYTDLLGAGDVSAVLFSGYWADPSQSSGQMLDSPQYITSWKSGGTHEGPVPIVDVVFSVGVFKSTRWLFQYARDSDVAWSLLKETDAGTPQAFGVSKSAFLPPNPLYYLAGVPADFSGRLRVELIGQWWTPGFNALDGDGINDLRYNGVFVRDDAKLISGRGTITAPKDLARYEVGQTIPVSLDLGDACSKKSSGDGRLSSASGYTLEITGASATTSFDAGCGPGTVTKDSSGKALQYVVQAGDSGKRVTFKLFNDLFLKDQTDIKAVDIGSSILPTPSLKFELTDPDGAWEEGDSVRITIVTNQTSVWFNIRVEQIGGGASILDVDHGTSSTYTITPTVAGTYRVAASIENSDASQVSNPVEQNMIIKEGTPPDFCTAHPTDPACVIADEIPLLAIILLIVGVLLILGGILLPTFGFRLKLVLFAVGGVLVLVAVLSLTGAL